MQPPHQWRRQRRHSLLAAVVADALAEVKDAKEEGVLVDKDGKLEQGGTEAGRLPRVSARPATRPDAAARARDGVGSRREPARLQE